MAFFKSLNITIYNIAISFLFRINDHVNIFKDRF